MSDARGFLGAGKVKTSRWDTGTQAWLPWQGPYESTKFEVKANSKTVEQTSRAAETYGQVIEAVALAQPSELSIELAQADREGMALAVLGTITTMTQAGSTATDEVVVAKLNAWVQLAFQNLTASSVVLTNSGATVTYVEGTDYEIDYTLGQVRALATITDNQSLKIDYAYGAIAGHKIQGGTNANLRVRVIFSGVNLADGTKCVVRCHEAVISSSSAFNFLDDKFNSIPLQGKLKIPSGQTAPFVIELPQG